MGGFWQFKNPADQVRAYLLAFQQFAGAPGTGVWDPASHAALYRMANQQNQDISAVTAWGAEPDKTVGYLLGLAQDTDSREEFSFARPFLVALGFPAMTFEEAANWAENLDPKEAEAITNAMKAVAETVGQAESVASVSPTGTAVDPQPASPAEPAPGPAPMPGTPTSGAPPTTAPAANGGTTMPGSTLPTVTVTSVPTPCPKMSTGKKVAIGVGIGLGLLTIAALAWKAFSKPKQAPMQGFEGFDGFDAEGLGDCGCMADKKGKRGRYA